MPIITTIDKRIDLTVFTVSGEMTYKEQAAALKDFYDAKPTANVLWDLRKQEGHRLTHEELQDIIVYVKSRETVRRTGKTAMVSNSDLDFGLARMIATFAEMENLPWEIQAFRTMDQALKWINA